MIKSTIHYPLAQEHYITIPSLSIIVTVVSSRVKITPKVMCIVLRRIKKDSALSNVASSVMLNEMQFTSEDWADIVATSTSELLS